MKEMLEKRVAEVKALLDLTLEECAPQIEAAAQLIIEAYQHGNGVFIFGNGGSAADAQHIAGELVGCYLKDRPPLKAQALVCDSASITSIANDYGYEQVFSRQLAGLASSGDIAWGLSTSGNSSSVVNAIKKARELGLKTLAITGNSGGLCAEYADVLIAIPSAFTPHIQEVGTIVYHCICEQVEAVLN